MVTQNGLSFNPLLATLSPDDQQTYMQLQQRQAIGQALLQQGLQPMDAGTNPVGGMAYHVSPLNGVSKMLNAYLGNKLSMDAMGQQAQLMSQMYGNAFGTNPQAPSAGVAPTQSAPNPFADAGGVTNGSSGDGVQSFPVPMDGAQPSGQQIGAAMTGAPQAPRAAAPGGPLTLPGKTPQESMMLYSMLGPEGYARVAAAWGAPTDATRMALAAHLDPAAANAGALFKANYVAPITGTGTFRDPRTMQPVAFNPDIPAGTTPLFDASGNVAQVQPIAGAQAAMQGNAAATAAGGAQFKPVQVYNPAKHQMEYSNEAAVTNPAAPAPIRNNNPGAMMPGGKLAQYPDMQTGLAALDGNLQSYGKQGINTISGVISKWAPPNENNTQAYIQDVSQRLGIKPDQKIDLSDPLQRQALSTAIVLHENGPQGVFGNGSAAPQGAPAAAPPLGTTTAADASQAAPSKQMATAQGALADSDNTYQASRQALLKMISITQNGGVGDGAARMLPEGVATRISSDAAEYQKAHANFISLQGKALGEGGTNQSRATLDDSVPTFDKPADAKLSGLNDQLNQLDWNHLKRQTLNPVYQQGDEKGYTQQSAAFDSAIQPSMMPQINQYLAMPAGAARTQALQQAIRDPRMKAALDLMVQTGQLK